jgi:hypothetical protein
MPDQDLIKDFTDKIGSIFYGDAKPTDPMSYQSLLARRKIAEAIMSKRSPFPKNIGEGLTYLGEKIADRSRLDELDTAERAQEAVDKETGKKAAEAAYPTVVPAAAATQPDIPPQRIVTAPPPPPPPSVVPARPMNSRPNLSETSMESVPITPALNPSVDRFGRPNAVPPSNLGPRSFVDPGSQADPRARIAMAALARQGVVPPDPTLGGIGMAENGPSSLIPASTTADEEDDDPRTAMAQANLNPMIRTDIEKFSMPPPGAREPPAPGGLPDVSGEALPPLKPNPRPTSPPRAPVEPGEREAFANVMGSRNPETQRQWNAVLQRFRDIRAAEDLRRAEQYKADVGYYEKEELATQAAAREREDPIKKAELLQKRYEVAKAEDALKDRAKFGALGVQGTVKILEESQKAHAQLPTALDAIARAKKLVESGTFTGPLSTADLTLNRVRVLAGGDPDPRIANTEEFRATVAKMFGGLRPNVGGPGSQSNVELEFLKQVAAGDVKFSKESVLRVLHSLEKDALNSAIQHQRSVNIASGTDPADQRAFSHFSLPMERILPQAYVDQFKENIRKKGVEAAVKGLQDQFHTPGLAKMLLDAERLD